MSRPSPRTLRIVGDELSRDWIKSGIAYLFEDEGIDLGPPVAAAEVGPDASTWLDKLEVSLRRDGISVDPTTHCIATGGAR